MVGGPKHEELLKFKDGIPLAEVFMTYVMVPTVAAFKAIGTDPTNSKARTTTYILVQFVKPQKKWKWPTNEPVDSPLCVYFHDSVPVSARMDMLRGTIIAKGLHNNPRFESFV